MLETNFPRRFELHLNQRTPYLFNGKWGLKRFTPALNMGNGFSNDLHHKNKKESEKQNHITGGKNAYSTKINFKKRKGQAKKITFG